MNAGSESGAALRGPLQTPERRIMSATYEKQEWLDKSFIPVSIKEAFGPLAKETGVDIFAFYSQDYNIKPTREGVPQEPVVTRLSEAGTDYDDVRPYFIDQEGRRYYRYIEARYHPEKNIEDCKDLLFVEELLPDGKIVSVFEYNDPYTFPVETAEGKARISYRKLRACYAVIPGEKREEDKAVELTSFWTGAQLNKEPRNYNNFSEEYVRMKRKFPEVGVKKIVDDTRREDLPEENRAISIGIVSQAPDMPYFDIVAQMNLLKEKGRLLITDCEGPEKWYELIYTAAAFSQNEGDKMEGHIRSDLPLGVIRSMLGETGEVENNAIDQFLASAIRQGADLRNLLQETRDWIRNRLAVSLYIFRKLHNAGIHFTSDGEYQGMITWAQGRMTQLQDRDSRLTTP